MFYIDSLIYLFPHEIRFGTENLSGKKENVNTKCMLVFELLGSGDVGTIVFNINWCVAYPLLEDNFSINCKIFIGSACNFNYLNI